MRNGYPDPGAEITLHLRSGKSFTGTITEGHVFAPDTVLCLAIPAHGEQALDWYINSAEHLWQYVNLADVEAWTWDCRP
jgi:hypothetical protein